MGGSGQIVRSPFLINLLRYLCSRIEHKSMLEVARAETVTSLLEERNMFQTVDLTAATEETAAMLFCVWMMVSTLLQITDI